MNYPGSIFELVDQSQYEPIPIQETSIKPLFMTAFTSDKGPEDFRVVEGEDFFKLYGDNISFEKHGQPLLQAANIINAGGRLFAKRVVDTANSSLANLCVYATITEGIQKKDADGNPLYDNGGTQTTDASHTETDGTVVNHTPIMIDNGCTITYATKTYTGKSSLDEVTTAFESEITDADDYPLFVITDIGRGTSNKYFNIVADLTSSKSSTYTKYMFTVKENNTDMETIQFAFNPDIVDGGANVSMQTRLTANSTQVKCHQFANKIKDLMTNIAKVTGLDETVVAEMDILFGKTRKGMPVTVNGSTLIEIAGTEINDPIGLKLGSGSDGDFKNGDMLDPDNAAYTSYTNELKKAFGGDETYVDTKIYDLDNYKIDCIVDANYPVAVKKVIEKLVDWRQDAFFFEDLGIKGLDSADAIVSKMTDTNNAPTQSKFVGVYHTNYEIIDPYSKKQVRVTMLYTLAKLLVSHFLNGRNRPVAGIINGMVLSDAIEGTVNYIPTNTPTEDAKEKLSEARVNYASYFDGRLVLESLYTNQDALSQFSFINNILSIQEVIKAVRTQCPAIRYSFIDGEDLEKYKEDVELVLDRYTTNFMSLEFEYISDATYISNKVFYAAIKVKFRNFVQSEYFRVIALPS